MNRVRTGVITAAALAGLAALTACSNASAGMDPTAMGGADHVMLTATEIAGIGKVVVAANGKTLYRYDKDSNQPPTSNCDDKCATTWSPAIEASTPMLEGVADGMIGTVVRKDGSKQLTLNGWPLYELATDVAGQANGQGHEGVWFAVTPEGGKASGRAAEGAVAPADGGSGY